MAGTEDTPARVAVEAHLRATCIRWGWSGYGDFREWWPTHLEHLLSETEASTLNRYRKGTKDHVAFNAITAAKWAKATCTKVAHKIKQREYCRQMNISISDLAPFAAVGQQL